MFKPKLTCYSPIGLPVDKPVTDKLFQQFHSFKTQQRQHSREVLMSSKKKTYSMPMNIEDSLANS